jgi:hypothetical protein
VEDAQLDGKISTKEDALELVRAKVGAFSDHGDVAR